MTDRTLPPAPLVLDGVTVALGDQRLVDRLSLTVEPGEIVTLMGPSGCGKSTLLAWVCGTLAPAFAATGRVRLGDADLTTLPPEARHLGILFQDDLLFPHLSVGGNIAFGIPRAVRGRAARRAIVEEALESAGLAGFADRDPATLSGGQRARVSLLRVLVSGPRALLLDEPFSKLDATLKDQFREAVFARARAEGLPTLLVTHDPDDAAAAGGRVLTLWS
ncbi:MAG: ATP-binding cassette domain-containing protein [Alphaproteobacteria bacterium]|nr:ATP-binding cassette domain-containing protein [Alphaproteobacteria bacterium]MDX5369695.1 ATP-binding cassette domain-containing protein [Alphaproteobacteria bacterium]MDX5464330.1 ATP-binding cassette domain-containing protein [Alphaproteobacteria bacterium]